MIELWNNLDPEMKIIWGITLTASLIFIIQTVMTFIGIDSDTDMDIDQGFDDPGDGMSLLTFRNLINFLLGFGWMAITLKGSIQSWPITIILSTITGIILVTLVMYLYKGLSRMQQSGTINAMKQAPGCTGTVYLTVPAERAGEGIVQITINNSVRDYAAVTDGNELKTGTQIKVIEAINNRVLLVEEINCYII